LRPGTFNAELALSLHRVGEREMLKLSLIVMFALSLATLSFAASAIPAAETIPQIVDVGL